MQSLTTTWDCWYLIGETESDKYDDRQIILNELYPPPNYPNASTQLIQRPLEDDVSF